MNDRSSEIQRRYFDSKEHRFPVDQLLNLSTAQKKELQDLELVLNMPKTAKLLDFGAGNGRVSLYFLARGHDVTAVDISPSSLESLRRVYTKSQTKAWGSLKTVAEIPEDATPDAIVGADVLHHVNMKDWIDIFYGHLREGGKIAFSEPNCLHLPWYAHYLLSGIPWRVEKGILQCRYGNFQTVLERSGFREFAIRPHGLLPTPLSSARWNYQLGQAALLRRLAF
ncbi:MAG: methyltransferase domain-containing protein, partial [Candidatus Promineifilaceae bacterium]|nr:methyltransferase domain-containing protein [Candidatus Promineifilaceae bacterium]